MAGKQALRTVQYGAPTDKCAVTVRLGIEKGIFEEEGLDQVGVAIEEGSDLRRDPMWWYLDLQQDLLAGKGDNAL